MFKPVKPGVNLSQLEEEIIKVWKEEKTFQKSLEKDSPKGDWTFLDGPPFVTWNASLWKSVLQFT